ncbi:hypothetical protein PSTG_14888 [Puccinia striiformis f. sp. tritici PST-78]|uniref:HAT C-terminal dimerisation domain-containing protein n=1 Tax=Puccinia striiformis f. sp. tritici PST-78 TaxID=1165861 RepID=A0A0L0UXS4_9BASI|nr:hypothetical protein PSTG_14888 [Puccinia striiformis f. sp. tritici PST-78]
MGVHLAEMIPFNNKSCLLGCMAHVINLAAQAGIKAFSSTPPPQTELPGDLANILHDKPPNVKVKTIISRISGLTSFLKHSPTKAQRVCNTRRWHEAKRRFNQGCSEAMEFYI